MAVTLSKIACYVAALSLVILGGFSAWSIAPYSLAPRQVAKAAYALVRAPFAEVVVVGESRVSMARAPTGAVLAGFGGATTADFIRFASVICRVSNSRIVIAAGINDTRGGDAAEAVANLAQIVESCPGENIALAEIWPAEPTTAPYGPDYNLSTLDSINLGIRTLASRRGLVVIPAQQAPTTDGVHFGPAVSAEYARAITTPSQ